MADSTIAEVVLHHWKHAAACASAAKERVLPRASIKMAGALPSAFGRAAVFPPAQHPVGSPTYHQPALTAHRYCTTSTLLRSNHTFQHHLRTRSLLGGYMQLEDKLVCEAARACNELHCKQMVRLY